MRSVYLGSTALLGVAMLATPAAAQLEVTISGTLGFQAGYWDTDTPFGPGDANGPDGDHFDFQTESEVVVRATGVADNGLEYGAKIEINTSTTDDAGNSDEVSLYVGGSWGRLEFGDFDSAADEMTVYAPTVRIGQVDGAYTDFAGGEGPFGFKPIDSGDSTKINYYTPRFAGFRLGVSYAPYSNEGEEVVTDARYEDFIEVGVDYTNTFGAFSLLAAATYVQADSNGANNFGVDGQDIEGWTAGVQVGWGAFTIGAGYVDSESDDGGINDLFGTDRDGWSVGATYEQGPWGFGVSYVFNDMDGQFTGSVFTDEYQAIGAGAVYTLAPGLTLGADIVYWERDDAAIGAADEDGFVVVTEVRAAF